MRLAPLLALGVVILAPAAAAPPESAPAAPEMTERLFRAAQDLERDHQVDQARQTYRQLLEADPSGPRAPAALLGLARLAWPTSDAAELGTKPVDAVSLSAAKEHLETIAKKFPASPEAPEALWRLALLHLEPGSPLWSHEQGLAQLTTLLRLHPAAPEAPYALALAARLHNEAGRFSRARGLVFRLLADWPEHVAAGRGWLALATADAREGRLSDALWEAGRGRIVAQGQDETAAREALGLSTVLDRVTFSAARGARPFEFTPGPGMIFAGKPRDLAAGRDGSLLATVPGDKQLMSFPAGGAAPSTRSAPGAEFIAVDPWGRTWTGGGATVLGPSGVGALALPERTEIAALAVAGARAAWVADERSRRVFRFEAGLGITATARLGEKPEPVALAPDGLGGVWVLDVRGPTLVDIDADGSPRSSVALDAVARDPVDLDVDRLGDVYVLDAEMPALLVFSPAGQLVVRQPLPREGDPAFPRAALIAVDDRGAVAVYDSRKRKAIWLR